MRGTPADWLAHVATTHRWKVVVGFLVATVVASLAISEIRTDFTPSDLFAAFEDQKEVVESFRETYGNSDNVVMVLLVGDDVLRQKAVSYIHEVSRGAADLEGIERVESITATPIPRVAEGEAGKGSVDAKGTISQSAMLKRVLSGRLHLDPVVEGESVEAVEAERLREALSDAPIIEGRLVSRDRSVAAVTLFVDRDVTKNSEIESTVDRLRKWLEVRPPPDGYQVRLSGLPYVRTVVVEKMRADQAVLLPAAIIVSLLILLLAFRWWPAAFFPLLAVVAATAMLVGGMAFVGEPFNIVNNIVPLLVIVIGISDAIHLINRYGEEYEATGDVDESARRAVRAMATACFLTSFTTAAGFASLAVANTEILSRFGVTAAIGVLLVYLTTILLIPALLPVIGAPNRIARQSREGRLEDGIERLTSWLLRRPWTVAVTAGVSALVPIYFASGVEVDNAVLDQLDEESEVYRTTKLIERKLYGVRPLEVSLRSERPGRFLEPQLLNRIDDLQAWAEEQEGVLRTSAPTDYLHEAWYLATGDESRRRASFDDRKLVASLRKMYRRASEDPLSRFLADEGRGARVSIQLRDVGAKATIGFARKLEKRAGELFGDEEGVDVRLTGDAYVASLGLDVVIRDLLWSLATAFVVIFGFLALVLGSGRLALLSIPSNVAPLVVTMGYMSLRDVPINAATAIIFSISIGLAVDGTIHLLARFREERTDDTLADDALMRSARGTGKAIILTYLALMLGFGVMLFSSFVPVRRFGELISVTVCVCLVATVLVLPVLLKIGRTSEE